MSSFLIANGRLGISPDANGEMHVSLTRLSENQENQPKINQGIFSMNSKQAFEMLKACGLAETLEDGWSTRWTSLYIMWVFIWQ